MRIGINQKKLDKFTSLAWPNKETIIENEVRKSKAVIYGARAMNMNLKPRIFGFPIFGRDTSDYDIFHRRPRPIAKRIERSLDRGYGADLFFVKEAIHPGTWKVMSKGQDNRANTEDDVGVADVTRPTRKLRTRTINGVKYAALSERAKDARRSLTEKQYEFRWWKDREDLRRIKLSRQLGGGGL
jgi:hypothetical protein